MKNLLITGATGMIGSAIVEEALKQNYKITCLVRSDSNRISNIPKSDKVKVVDCNINQYNEIELTEKYDVSFHLAWLQPFGNDCDNVEFQLKNVQYTLYAVNLAKRAGCRVFIGAGSQAEYGIQKVDLTPALPVNPESGYGIAKYTAGKLANMLCQQLEIRFNWLRILSVYGKNDNSYTLISYVINELKNGRSPELTKCEQIWDYLHCDDAAARAFLAVAEVELLCEQENLPAERFLMIGDTYESDIRMADRAGCKSILISDENNHNANCVKCIKECLEFFKC